jgi:glycosyltransferase involved in cell wall biosynthesis
MELNPSTIENATLPNVLYIGDVPIEHSYHGSALIARLLDDYPLGKLVILEMGSHASLEERRVKGAVYRFAPNRWNRWLNTRFHRWASSLSSVIAPWRSREISAMPGSFKPQIVLTVAHGYSWIAAFRYARKNGLSFAMIVHDDWPQLVKQLGFTKGWVEHEFGLAYRYASARFCVSPGMVAAYEARYGVSADVLYPLRAGNARIYDQPPTRPVETRPFTVAFAGTVNGEGYANLLRTLASAIEEIEGRLCLFGPLSKEQAAGIFGSRKAVEVRGMLSARALAETCRTEVDLLYAPMSFDEQDRNNMSLAFPSKLADYTAMGLPILIHGPEYCSAVRWALDNPGAAMVTTSIECGALEAALTQISQDPNTLEKLGAAAIAVGRDYFSRESVRELLLLRFLECVRA